MADNTQELQNILNDILSIKVEQLKREQGDYKFEDIYSMLVEIYSNIEILKSNLEFWLLVPENRRNNILNNLKELNTTVKRIKTFEPQSLSNPLNERNNLANNIKNTYGVLYDQLFLDLKIHNLSKQLKTRNLNQIANESKKLFDEINKIKENSEETLKAIQSASASAGVSKFAEVFEQEANRYKKSANIWLIVSILVAIGVGYFMSLLFTQLVLATKNNLDFNLSIQLFLAKLLLISFFSYILYHVVKNYNANMHLYTVNKHRENSLKTFQSFVKSTEDKKIQDVILTQATKAIFEVGDSGYLSSKEKTIRGLEITKIFDGIDKK